MESRLPHRDISAWRTTTPCSIAIGTSDAFEEVLELKVLHS